MRFYRRNPVVDEGGVDFSVLKQSTEKAAVSLGQMEAGPQ